MSQLGARCERYLENWNVQPRAPLISLGTIRGVVHKQAQGQRCSHLDEREVLSLAIERKKRNSHFLATSLIDTLILLPFFNPGMLLYDMNTAAAL